MSRFLPYSPDQAYLLPPSVKDELGPKHLCFFIHGVVEQLELGAFEQAYSEEGGALYAPGLMLKVWLYAYAVGITSARRLEQRLREDLALRYLAGGAKPDNWALSAFRRRHARGLNEVFTQVLELAREVGLGRLGTVAIDSTRVKASASPDRVESGERLRQERARLRRQVRRWQKQCDAQDDDGGAGTTVAVEVWAEVEKRLASIPARLERLARSGAKKLSPRDPEARFLRQRGGFVLGYTAEVAVSEDHLIVAQRVTQNAQDASALLPVVAEVHRRCGQRPTRVLADAGFYSNQNVAALAQAGIDAYIPDPNLAHELHHGKKARTIGRMLPSDPHLCAMRRKLRRPAGRRLYQRRKAIVEPVFGTLKAQRGLAAFRLRGLNKVGTEWTLATVAYNLVRIYGRK